MDSLARILDGPEGRHRAKVGAAGGLLLLIAGASGLGWRFEVDSRGWRSLDWVDYFHVAFPAAMAAFVVWALATVRLVHRLSPARTGVLGVLLVPIATAGYFLIPAILLGAYGGWGGGLLSTELARNPLLTKELPRLFSNSSHALELLFKDLAFWSAWLAPTVAIWLSLRATGVRSRLWSVPLSGTIQFWAWPVACWGLAIVDHIGGSDPIHALKSGFVIPFLVVAVGIPFLAVPPPPSTN